MPMALLIGLALIRQHMEQRHYHSIREREATWEHIPCLNHKHYNHSHDISYARLVDGSIVIAAHPFRQLLVGIRNFFGGEVHAYYTLVDRGRREALLRMKESAPNADMFVNVRLMTSALSSGGQKQMGTIEVMAYGTALKFRGTARTAPDVNS